jgi:hypothetical protein
MGPRTTTRSYLEQFPLVRPVGWMGKQTEQAAEGKGQRMPTVLTLSVCIERPFIWKPEASTALLDAFSAIWS